jgi:hypothetical protein
VPCKKWHRHTYPPIQTIIPITQFQQQVEVLLEKSIQEKPTYKLEVTMGMGNPMGTGTIQNDGNGHGQEWEQTLMGMGMCHIPMGIDSHRLV